MSGAAEAGEQRPAPRSPASGRPPSPQRPPSLAGRLLGLGSVFGKSARDALPATLVVGLLAGGMVAFTAAAFAAEWDTLAERRALAAEMALLPAFMQGILGQPIGLDTLPGFLSWRAVSVLPVLVGVWPIVALSGTLAGEAGRGSLELLAATPISRARIAAQKAAAHVVALAAAMLLGALLAWLACLIFARLPGDETTLPAALSHFALVGALSLTGGAAAFACGPFLGRGASAGVGAAVLYGSFIVNGYSALVPGFDRLRVASAFGWTANHRPLAGREDWLPLAVVVALCVLLLAIGVVAFARRDLGATVRLRNGIAALSLPRGLRGVLGRSMGERLPGAFAFGVGFGLLGLVLAASADEFARLVGEVPGLKTLMERFLGGRDLLTSGGVLQLFFFGFGSLLMGLAAATLVAGWASDELEGRLDLVLGAPLSRRRWVVLSGLGVYGAVAALTGLAGVLVAIGAAAAGDDAVAPVAGIVVLGLFAAAHVGIGLAVAGLGWPHLAAGVVVGITFGSFLLDLLGRFLGLPDVVLDLALVRHLGQPMLGEHDPGGLVVCGVLAVGGLCVAAWGMSRRDVAA